MKLSLRTAGRIAWRETRSSLTKFLFVVLAVAAGVGALSGVRGFSESFHSMLTREARTVMAADLAARQFVMPTQEQLSKLDDLASQGIEHTWITETVSMAAPTSGESANAVPVLAAVKAVDPAKYPYYGEIKLDPPMPLAQALAPDTVAASDDLLMRLHLHTGDSVRVGNQDFRIAAVIVSEPDRMSASLNFGMRLMMSREAFERAGLMQIGSRASQRYLFKLDPGAPDVEQVRRTLRRTLPDSMVMDFRQSHPIITSGLDQATTFLSLISLIALIIGAIGVAMAMHAHLQQKMDNIAVMKSLGASSGEIIRIFMLQTMMLGVLGGIAGVAVGRAVEQVFPLLIKKYFPITLAAGWHLAAATQGIGVGVLTTLLFTLPPLLAIRKIRPGLILRRDMPEAKQPWRKRLFEAREALAAGGVILIGIGAIAAWLADSPRVGGYFAAGLTASLDRIGDRRVAAAPRAAPVFAKFAVAHSIARSPGNGESLSSRQSGAGDFDRAGTRRDVYDDRISGAKLAGRPDHRYRATRNPKCIPSRRHAGAGRAVERSHRAFGGRGRSHLTSSRASRLD